MTNQPDFFVNLTAAFDPREQQVYAALGEETLRAVVERFYDRVDKEPLLRFMFPPSLSDARERQSLFLIQFFGGPRTYSDNYGHPRLRMRHMRFPIGMVERDTWLGHMLAAIEETGIEEPWAGVMGHYFEQSSLAMMNKEE